MNQRIIIFLEDQKTISEEDQKSMSEEDQKTISEEDQKSMSEEAALPQERPWSAGRSAVS